MSVELFSQIMGRNKLRAFGKQLSRILDYDDGNGRREKHVIKNFILCIFHQTLL
jgi:hypothetical protein